MSLVSALDRVEELYANRSSRAAELRAAGKRVVGYFCCYPPAELLTALDLVPFRIQGSVDRPVSAADAYLESNSCSFIRSCFDLALEGQYDFLDGLIVPHTCDTVDRIFAIWRHFRKPRLAHYLNVPNMIQPSSFVFFRHEVNRLTEALEDLAGKKLERDALVAAIDLHNEQRGLLRRLYGLRKASPPPVAGSTILKTIVAGMCLPVAEHVALLREIIPEVESRPSRSAAGRPRIMICGSELDHAGLVDLLEESGADVVVDDMCTGTRTFWPDVPVTDDPMDGLVQRYLAEINCPRTYRPQQRPHAADVEYRFGYLGRFAREFGVEGVVLYIIRFCDTHEIDAPDIIDYFKGQGIPVLHLEEEYRLANVGQIKVRAEAFLETIGG